MSAESAIRALQALGLKPDPSENEKLSAIAAGEPIPRGDAEREHALFRRIYSAACDTRILIPSSASRARRTSPRSSGRSPRHVGAALAFCAGLENATSRYFFPAST
jgi:hypothetical protein